jgi:hypothetical protein
MIVQGSDFGYWLFWVMGTLLIGLCVIVTWWGLFGDRARGRRRCPHCWYDLSHSPGMTCPECGHTATKERRFHRTRRRLLPAFAAALAASLGAAFAIEQAKLNGWVSLLPTRAILATLPLVGGAHGDLTDELDSRVGRRQISDSELHALIRRCISGDRLAVPVSARWESKYGGLLQQCRTIAPAEFGLDDALLALPPRLDISSVRPWPHDAPLCLDLELRDWWPSGTACRVLLTPTWAGGEPITVGRTGAYQPRRPFPLVIDAPPDLTELNFDAVVERRMSDQGAGWESILTRSLAVTVEREGALAEVIRPVASEELEEAMRATFGAGVVKWTSGRSPLRVRFDRRHTFNLGTDDTLFGASIEILRGDTLARQLDIWWPGGPDNNGEGVGWLVAFEDVSLVMEANDDDGHWQMRVRGNPALALRAGIASAYWAGEFVQPLVVRDVGNPAPPKDWWVESVDGEEFAQ